MRMPAWMHHHQKRLAAPRGAREYASRVSLCFRADDPNVTKVIAAHVTWKKHSTRVGNKLHSQEIQQWRQEAKIIRAGILLVGVAVAVRMRELPAQI